MIGMIMTTITKMKEMTTKNIEKLIIENFVDKFNKIKRIDENELPNWLKNMTDEDRDFLESVKEKTPETYLKILNIFKNKGSEEAKKEYQKFDPVFLKKQEKEKKSLETKKLTKEKIEELKTLLPSKEEVKNIIERNFLTQDFRYISEKLLFPQLSINAIESKVTNLGKDLVAINYNLNGVKKFNNIKELDNTIAKGINDDVILDSVLKTIKNYKTQKKYERKYGKDFDNEDWYFDNSLKIFANLKIRIAIQKRYLSVYSNFRTDISLGPEYPEKIFFKEEYESTRLNLDVNTTQKNQTKEDVLYLLVNVMVKLHSKINTDDLVNILVKYLYK